MLTIVLCEDNKIYADKIIEIAQNAISADIVYYKSGEELLDGMKNGISGDIYLMDIELPEMNGMETAYRIKQNNRYAVIIFLTDYEKYVYDAFEVEAFRYIPKRNMEEKLKEALKAALESVNKLRESSYYIVTDDNGNFTRLELREIISIEKNGKYVEIYTVGGRVYRDRSSLVKVLSQINKAVFAEINRSTLINVEQIDRFDQTDIIMTDGTRHKVSRGKKKQVQRFIMDCWESK